ncbi:hypothetical protein V6N11_069474 [Hibiscus sabdariffa]|uniref:Uncharacterized protein n=1 Tax=Hibiscus sabdariffa TaxID=183260 RepID=A0ABR2Q2X1_9ROSI
MPRGRDQFVRLLQHFNRPIQSSHPTAIDVTKGYTFRRDLSPLIKLIQQLGTGSKVSSCMRFGPSTPPIIERLQRHHASVVQPPPRVDNHAKTAKNIWLEADE